MDKIKQILEVLRKHHFWILCGVAALVAVIVWQMSTSSLDDQFQKDSQAVDQSLKKVKDVQRDEAMARQNWKDLKEKETEALKQEVGERWQKLYDEQKKEVFKWDNVPADDVARLETPGQYERELRDRYAEAIKTAALLLTKIVDAPPPEVIPVGVGSAPAAPAGGQYKVSWSSESLDTIRQSFDWVEQASTLNVRQAQEEFWVYRALCNVIKAVNDIAGGEVPIRQIVDMKIAYLAVEDSSGGASGAEKRIDSIVQAAVGDAAAPAPAAQADTSAAVKPVLKDRLKSSNTGGLFGGGAAGAGGAGGKDDEWKRFRYVKTTNPLASTGEPIREPAEYDEAVKTAKYFLMPFDLEVLIDDRYVDRLLMQMRNSPLPLEVQQVRINPVNVTTGYGGGGGGAEHGGGMTPLMVQQMANRGGGVAGGASGQVATNRYITVELRGVAYLLAPPNLQKASEAPGGATPGSETTTAANNP